MVPFLVSHTSNILMCSNHVANFIDLISDCSVRVLPHNITECSLTYFVQHSLGTLALKVTVIVWDDVRGWSLTRRFYFDEHNLSLSDPVGVHQVTQGIVTQIKKNLASMVSDHPDELRQTINQFHLYGKL